MNKLWVVLGIVLALAGCGQNQKGDNPSAGGKVNVHLFAAPWCIPCQDEIKAVKAALDGEKNADRALVTIYMTTGKKATQLPTQDVADQFKSDLGVTYPVALDARWAYYRTYFANGNLIPASVILNEKGDKVLKVFEPGGGDPDAKTRELIDYIKSQIK